MTEEEKLRAAEQAIDEAQPEFKKRHNLEPFRDSSKTRKLRLWLNIIFMLGAIAGTTLNMVGYCCVTAGVPAHMSRIVDPAVLGTANGLVQAFISLGAFAGPMLSAALLATGSEVAMDVASAALALACLALAIRLGKRTPAGRAS